MATGEVSQNIAEPEAPRPPVRRGRSNGRGRGGLLVCRKATSGVVGVLVRGANGGAGVQRVAWQADQEQTGQRTFGRCTVVAVLPKTDYLVRALDVPKASSDETDAMIRLEVDAFLPPDLGDVEISYRPLPSRRDGYRRFEVYIVRRPLISGLMADLQSHGLTVDVVLPSASVWSLIFDELDDVDLVVAAPVIGDDGADMELAIRESDMSLSIRSVKSGPQGLGSGLLESLRSLLAGSAPDGAPANVGWIGGGLPDHSLNGKVSFKPLDDLADGRFTCGSVDSAEIDFLVIAGLILQGHVDDESLAKASLLPQQLVTQRLMKRMIGRMVASVACVALGLMCVYGAMAAMAWRYSKIEAGFSERIATIVHEGETVECRLRHLKAVRQARLSSSDFAGILGALLEATPEGVSYSQVELTPDYQVHLRGQSESLASALLLPERIEKQPVFDQAMLRDVGQTSKAGGGITEFRVDCFYRRPNTE